jgi:REP element-mobilizing transposase RayT
MKSTILDQRLFTFAIAPHRRGPKRTKDSSVPHEPRPKMPKGSVAHVTIKLKPGLPSLRKGAALDVVLSAIERVNDGELIRIVEYSVQSNHVHFLVEAANLADLSKGMASLNTGLGMRLNRIWNRTGEGSVFKERFHLVVVNTPTQMRRALNYVLRNDAHHGLNLGRLDPCSSAPAFGGWEQLQGEPFSARRPARDSDFAPRLLKHWPPSPHREALTEASHLTSLHPPQ